MDMINIKLSIDYEAFYDGLIHSIQKKIFING